MKESMWMYFFASIGMIGIVLINIFGKVVVSNEQNYYLLKEVTEAAMYDALDLNAIRNGIGYDGVTIETDPESMHCIAYKPGTKRIIKEKFVESFIRRFSENAELNRNYRIVIHDIDECPPKVSLSLIATNNFDFVTFLDIDFSNGETAGGADIINSLTGIIEDFEKPIVIIPKSESTPEPTPTPDLTPTLTPTPTQTPTPTPTSTPDPVVVDNTPPRCKYEGNSSWTRSALMIRWGCEDDESGCTREWYGSNYYNGISREAEGFIDVSYTISDKAGNTTECNYTGYNKIPVYYDHYTPACTLRALDDGKGETVIRMDTDEEGSSLKFVGIAGTCESIDTNLYTRYADLGPGTYCGKAVDNVDLTGYCYITLYEKNADGTCPTGTSVGRYCAQ